MKRLAAITLLLALSAHGIDNITEAIIENCTQAPQDPYYLSDEQIIWYNYWQLGAAGFAIISIAFNFPSAYYFYRRQEHNHAAILQANIEAIEADNHGLRQRLNNYQIILDKIKNKHRTIDEDE